MALREDVISTLRSELGEGFKAAPLGILPAKGSLLRAFLMRELTPKLKAVAVGRLDDTALVASRQAAEQALRDEEVLRKAEIEATLLQLEADIRGF